MHIPGHIVGKFVEACPDKANGDLQLAVVLPGQTEGTPLRTRGGEPVTLDDLRQLMAPFRAWMGD